MSHSLLMTSRVMVHGPDGSSVESRALLDLASASFVSEQLAQGLCLPRSRQTQILLVLLVSHMAPHLILSLKSLFHLYAIHQDKSVYLLLSCPV